MTIDNINIDSLIQTINESNYKNDVKEKLIHIATNFFNMDFWGRNYVMRAIKCSSGASYNLIHYLLELNLIEPVTNHGKSKYKFK